MNRTRKEQLEQLVTSGRLHINLEEKAGISEEIAESILKVIESIEEEENERS